MRRVSDRGSLQLEGGSLQLEGFRNHFFQNKHWASVPFFFTWAIPARVHVGDSSLNGFEQDESE
jgi:hypothetical protein